MTVNVAYPDPVLADMSENIQSSLPEMPGRIFQPLSQPVVGTIAPVKLDYAVSEGSRVIVFMVETISENGSSLIAIATSGR